MVNFVETLVMRVPSLVCVSSCCFPIRFHGTFIIMNLAQNVLYVLSKCVCVWNFSREVKLVPELPWHYFGSISTYSVEPLSHLVFRMSNCFFVLVLADKEFPYCNTILAGGTGPLWIPVPTKLFHNGGSED